MITPDALRALPVRERLAALRALSLDERADLDRQMTEARETAAARYGPAERWTPEPPCVDLH